MGSEQYHRFPWWYWIWIGHLLFVGFMYIYMFTPYKPDWFKLAIWSVSLAAEQNYAVWWSGFCLLVAASLFYRAASAEPGLERSWRWIVLTLAFLALAADEVASLHEMVSKNYGWEGLIPFALAFGAGIGAVLYSMLKSPGYRLPAFLIFTGIVLFASVASLEFIEHNIEMERVDQKRRLIIEEGTELVAMSLIIIAGLLTLKRLEIGNRTLAEVIGNIRELALHNHVIFVLFAANFLLIAGFAIPNAGKFSEGNPSGVFPIFLYFVLSMICIRIARSDRNERVVWWGFALLFLFTSLCQIHSFTLLMQRLLLDFTWFSDAPESWLITLLPLALLGILFLSRHWVSVGQLLPHILVFVPVSILLYLDNHSPMSYYLFSGCTAYLCYRLLAHRSREMESFW